MPIAIPLGLAALALTLVLPPPVGLSEQGWIAAGVAAMMAIWWLTEALPLAATALVPLALFPMLGIADLSDISNAYSHPLIILFLGGFMIAKAIERWGLHRRIAGSLLRVAGTSPHRILAALMMATAFLSLWISNTAAAMVIAPIAAAIASSRSDDPRFATALMLGVAFAATIGGMGSLIGTPPNAIFAAYVRHAHGVEIGFAHWAAVGVPVATILLLIAWILLAHLSPRFARGALRTAPLDVPGPPTPGEARVAVIAGLTALAWISRPLIEWLIPGMALTDGGIAIMAAVLLFLVPSGHGSRLLDWQTAATLRWDVLILFGGGLALATAIDDTGLAAWIGVQTKVLQELPLPILVAVIAAIVVYLGELASNTAIAAIFLPIASAAALSLGADPVLFMLPVALAASVGFMLPVATPPNAIVFSHPSVTRAKMLQAGAPLDVIGIAVAVGLSLILGPYVF